MGDADLNAHVEGYAVGTNIADNSPKGVWVEYRIASGGL